MGWLENQKPVKELYLYKWREDAEENKQGSLHRNLNVANDQ